MKTVLIACAMTVAATAPGLAASLTNAGGGSATLVITEEGERSEIIVDAGETVDFCPSGCFVTLPNGDREVLTGSETIEITTEGRARVR